MIYRVLIIIFLLVAYSCDSPPSVNFNEDIAPIVYTKCQSCHKKGGIAPFAFTNYSEVADYAKMIKEVTASRYMPPWSADPYYQSYLYERALSKDEIDLIGYWVEQGFPEGPEHLKKNADDFLPSDTLQRKPDLTICMEESFIIKGNNKDAYQTFVIPVNLEKDRFVQSMEFRPGNISVVHHAQVLVDSSGRAYAIDQKTPEYGFNTFSEMRLRANGILTGYLPGGEGPVKYPDGTGKKVYKNSYVIFNIHYAPVPYETEDLSCLDLYFSKGKKPRAIKGQTVNMRHITNGEFLIKANQTKYFHAQKTIPEDISLIAIWPHMHFRGKKFEAYAETPQGKTIPLVKINNWDFNWQNAYFLKQLIHIPKASNIYMEGTFDNRASNPFNPVLPPVDVRWGSSSLDEMLILGLEYLDYKTGDENQALDEY